MFEEEDFGGATGFLVICPAGSCGLGVWCTDESCFSVARNLTSNRRAIGLVCHDVELEWTGASRVFDRGCSCSCCVRLGCWRRGLGLELCTGKLSKFDDCCSFL